MEKELQDRLREALAPDVGEVHGRPAIDWHERQSNDEDAFSAIVLTTVSPGRSYHHDGADGAQRPRVRAEIFALSALTAKALRHALIAEMERAVTRGSVIFGRAQLAFERDADPEDLDGGTKVFRTILDFFVPISTQ